MFWKICVLALTMSATAFSASAQSRPERVLISEPVQGYAYYNRPGATLDDHDSEFRDCVVATQVRPNNSATPSIAMGLVWGGVIQAIGASAIENCMITRGWRVFQLPEVEGRTFARLSDDAFLTAFAPLVGEATPPGILAREWENQTYRPASYHTPSRARAPGRDQLSARAFKLRTFEIELRSIDEANGPILESVRGVPLDQIHAPGPGKAIIIAAGVGNRILTFTSAAETRGGVALWINGSRQGAWQAFEVPAGRYRISRTSWIIHCLGSPAFDIAPGEVLYAGRFDLEGPSMGPGLNPAEVPGQLDTDLRERLRPAQYQNGSTAPCPYGLGIYPLEFPGAPFEPGYRWGSLATPATTPN